MQHLNIVCNSKEGGTLYKECRTRKRKRMIDFAQIRLYLFAFNRTLNLLLEHIYIPFIFNPWKSVKLRSKLLKEQSMCKHLGEIASRHLLKTIYHLLPFGHKNPQPSPVQNNLMFSLKSVSSLQQSGQSPASCYLKSGVDVDGAPQVQLILS